MTTSTQLVPYQEFNHFIRIQSVKTRNFHSYLSFENLIFAPSIICIRIFLVCSLFISDFLRSLLTELFLSSCTVIWNGFVLFLTCIFAVLYVSSGPPPSLILSNFLSHFLISVVIEAINLLSSEYILLHIW